MPEFTSFFENFEGGKANVCNPYILNAMDAILAPELRNLRGPAFVLSLNWQGARVAKKFQKRSQEVYCYQQIGRTPGKN